MEAFLLRHDHDFSEIRFVWGYPTPGQQIKDPYAPFGRLLRNLLGVDETQPAKEAGRLLIDRLKLLGPEAQELLGGLAAFMGPLGLPMPEISSRADSFSALIRFLSLQPQPLVILLESFEEISSGGLELLAQIKEQLNHRPILILVEVEEQHHLQDPSFFRHYGHKLLPLKPLDEHAVAQLLMKLLGRVQAPPDNLLDRVMSESRGLPHAILQAAHTLEQSGLTPKGGLSWGVEPDAPLDLGFALTSEEASRRRLEVLPEADRVWLRRAAVVGPLFWLGALKVAARAELGSPAGLRAWLLPPPPDLQKARTLGIISLSPNSSLPDEEEYRFERESDRLFLYAGLEPGLRRRLHAVIAQWMEWRLGENPAQLIRIAQQYQQGGNSKRSAYHYIQAGIFAQRAFANEAAIDSFEKALALLEMEDSLPLLDVLHALGSLHTHLGRPRLAEACFERMLAGAWLLEHRAKAGAALNRLGRILRDEQRFERAQALLEAGRGLFEAAGDPAGVASSLDDLGQLALLQGDSVQAEELLKASLEFRIGDEDGRGCALSLSNLGRLYRAQGEKEAALEALQQSLSLRQELDDLGGESDTQRELALLYRKMGQQDRALKASQTALAISKRVGHVGRILQARTLLAQIALEAGDLLRAQSEAQNGLPQARALGDLRCAVQLERILSLLAVDPELGLARLESLEDHSDLEERAERLRAKSQLLRRRGDRLEPDLALQAWTQAAEVGIEALEIFSNLDLELDLLREELLPLLMALEGEPIGEQLAEALKFSGQVENQA